MGIEEIRFKIVKDEFMNCKCMMLQSSWHPSYESVINKENISVLRLSASAGWHDTDLNFLKNLTHLKGLEIYNYNIQDLTPVYSIPDLKLLSIDIDLKNQLDLSMFPKLKIFICDWSPKIKHIEGCRILEYINISKYPFDSFNEISELKELKRVSVSSRKLSSLDGMSSFVKLESLQLYACSKLLSLKGIENAKNLQTVEIASCTKFNDISYLCKLKKLKRLLFENCGPIDSLSCLKNCSDLETLFVIGNKPIVDGDLTVIEKLPNLQKVAIANKRNYNLTQDQINEILRAHKSR